MVAEAKQPDQGFGTQGAAPAPSKHSQGRRVVALLYGIDTTWGNLAFFVYGGIIDLQSVPWDGEQQTPSRVNTGTSQACRHVEGLTGTTRIEGKWFRASHEFIRRSFPRKMTLAGFFRFTVLRELL